MTAIRVVDSIPCPVSAPYKRCSLEIPPAKGVTRPALSIPLLMTVAGFLFAFAVRAGGGTSSAATILGRSYVIVMVLGGVGALTRVIVGKVLGLSIAFLTWGPVSIRWESGRMTLGANRSWRYYFGHACLVPEDLVTLADRSKVLEYTQLGLSALAGMIAAWVLLKPYFLSCWTITSGNGSLWMEPWCWSGVAFPFVALLVMVLAGIRSPLPGWGTPSVVQLGTDERSLALWGLSLQSESGLGPRHWNARWIQVATETTDGSIQEGVASLYGYYWACDLAEYERARDYLSRAAEIVVNNRSEPLTSWVRLELAFFESRFGGDIALASSSLKAVVARNVSRLAWLRSQTALALVQGDLDEATNCIAEATGEILLPPSEDEGFESFERGLFDRMKMELVERTAELTVTMKANQI